MPNERRIKISLSNSQGKHEFVFTPDGLNDLISTLIEKSLAPLQRVTTLHSRTRLKRHPIPVEALALEPAEDGSGELILIVCSRALELQFRVSADHLGEFYQRLRDAIEPDPSPPRRQ
jgi:hypothetical protein